MPLELARKLLSSGIVQKDELERALAAHLARGVPLLRALIDAGALSHRVLEDELGRIDVPTIRSVMPIRKLYDALPVGMCRALLALPVRLDPRTKTVDVAAADPFGKHVEKEFGYHLRAPIRVIRAPLGAIEEALARVDVEPGFEAGRASSRPPPPPRVGRITPTYLERFEEPQYVPTIPHLGRHNSDMPIPLTRSKAPAVPSVPPPPLPAESSLAASLASVIPSTQPGPFSPRAPSGPFPSTAPVLQAIHDATSRDEVVDLLLSGLSVIAGRVGAFVVRKGEFRGWRCTPSMGDAESFRAIAIPASIPSILATAAATGFYLGPVPRTAAHATLHAFLGDGGEVAASPVRIEGVLAMVLLLGDLGDSMIATRRAEELAKAAGESLAKVVQKER